MGRGKRRRKWKQRQRRVERLKRGKRIRFDLQNSPKKYRGFNNRYCYQTNIHCLIYKGAEFSNVRFQSSNLTKCNFRDVYFNGVDFCNCNLKGSKFNNAVFEKCIFVNCNLKESDFTDAKFKEVYFIMTNIKVAKGINANEIHYMNIYPKNLRLNSLCETALIRLGQVKEISKFHVLHVSQTKINLWIVSLLMNKYGEDIGRAFDALLRRKDKRFFYTVNFYMKFIESYLKI